MTSPAQHVREHAAKFSCQPCFSRVSFAVAPTEPATIVLSGYVATVDDFHALKDEWAATQPPCVTSVFVHIDPPR